MSKYSKINFVYFMQKWMDSVPGQTFLNYAYSWGASVVILGTLFKLTHLPGANLALFLGMGTEVFVFFISAFDRPFDKSTIDMTLDNHMSDEVIDDVAANPLSEPNQEEHPAGTIIIGAGIPAVAGAVTRQNDSNDYGTSNPSGPSNPSGTSNLSGSSNAFSPSNTADASNVYSPSGVPEVGAPAPAVTPATAEAMELATEAYVERLEQLNETLKKVEELSSRLATDSEEMENLNRTLTGIARVYEMQLKSASQQITTQDSINEQTRIMADKIKELNNIYARMIEAMTVNMPKGA